MKLRWTPEAANDLEGIYRYLLTNQPAMADSTIDQIQDELRTLSRFPLSGRNHPQEGLRELVMTKLPYIRTYRVHADRVLLLHIEHAALDRGARLQ